jgi:hypothetical protein
MKWKRDEAGANVYGMLRWMLALQVIGIGIAVATLGVSVWTYNSFAPTPPPAPTQVPFYPSIVPTRNIFTYFPFLAQLPNTNLTRPYLTWTEYGEARAYVEFAPTGNPTLTLADRNFNTQHFSLPYLPNWHSWEVQPEFVWSPSGDGSLTPTQRLVWSPDGNYVLLEYFSSKSAYGRMENTWYYSVFGFNGVQVNDFVTIPLTTEAFQVPRVVWMSNSTTLFFPRDTNRHSFFYDVMERQFYAAMPDANFSYPSFKRENGKLKVALQRGDTTMPLIEGADNIGEPYWSPDGGWVALVWGTGKGEARTVQLTWMRNDGFGIQTVSEQYQDIHDLQWIQSAYPSTAPRLAFVTSSKSGQRLEVRNGATGAIEFRGEQKAKLARLVFRPASAELRYWWRDAAENTGISAYNLTGARIKDSQIPFKIYGLEIFRDPYQWIGEQEIFPSWDGETYAIRHYEFYAQTPNSYHAAVIHADGAWSRVINDGDGAITMPCWTGDNARFYFYHHSSDSFQLGLTQVDVSTLGDASEVPINEYGATYNAQQLPCFMDRLK